jgi:hypothetical protein
MTTLRARFAALCAAAAFVLSVAPAAGVANAQAAADEGTYVPNTGFRIVNNDKGALTFKLFTYVRYLNQTALDDSSTTAFGDASKIDKRQDIQLAKVNVQFFGWILDPKFRYMAYVWTNNNSQGQGAQVVVGGNLQYAFNRYVTAGLGINSLPGTRSLEGNFPYWLPNDNRLISEEFFRPSYTTGIWAKGDIVDRVGYSVMLGNNLSQLGVDAGQMDNNLNTIAMALTWYPTTGEFGRANGFGDFERHDKPATRLGGHFSRSDENYQGQPNTEAFENVQLRLSDGSVIFTPALFGPGIWIQDATYRMIAVDGGLKYRGFSLEGEGYWRLIDKLRGPGVNTLDFTDFHDDGFQVQASAMVVPERLQLHAGLGMINGQYGDPSEWRAGLSWFPWRTQVARWNVEYIHLDHSPVGALSLPYVVGGNGGLIHADFVVNF